MAENWINFVCTSTLLLTQVELLAISDFDPAVAKLVYVFLDAGPLSFTACLDGLGASVAKNAKATLTHEALTALQCVAPIVVTRHGKYYPQRGRFTKHGSDFVQREHAQQHDAQRPGDHGRWARAGQRRAGCGIEYHDW